MHLKFITNLKDITIYSNMTIKDNEYYFLNNTKKIFRYDENFSKLDESNIPKDYNLLTYNSIKKNYLMILKKSTRTADELNLNYKILDTLLFNNMFSEKYIINDIYYDEYNNKYLVIDDKTIYSIDEKGNFIKNEFYYQDFYSINYNQCCRNNVKISPNDFSFLAICGDINYNYVAYIKNKSTFIAKLSKNGTLISTSYLGENINIKSIVIKDNKLYSLINENNIYEIVDDTLMDSRFEEIINQIINLLNIISINETNVANIVNVEAEKIKKILIISNDTTTILNANASATEMITEAVKSEDSQYNNLVLLLETLKELENI